MQQTRKEELYQKHMVDIIFVTIVTNIDFITVRNFESPSYILLVEEVTKYII